MLTDEQISEIESEYPHLSAMYQSYQNALKEKYQMDFDDQMVFALWILQKDEEIGVAAVQKNATILAHPLFYDRFCKSERVMLEALKKDVRSIRYLPNAFKQDVEFAKKALAIDKGFIAGFFYNVQKDEEIARILQE